ncbi:nitrate reductase molybdenum cofactor assembly chaperone [Propionibacteriaceae bacterium Y1923]|uniref:nitrate reductase molybdenum cofactor assembly chaperone n=1 Tax=Aestuariimicrobium sp. Y1814 TaxID=3418742 RepID=UPI003C28CCC6
MKEWLPTLRRRQAVAPRRKHPDPELGEADLRTAWQVISLLLDYPTSEGITRIPLLRRAASGLPGPVREPLGRLMDHLEAGELKALQSDYVDTFDTTRRCALHLTYYSYGDTRKRGIALVQFKQAFRRGGLEVTEDELPDHLGVVLEFGSLGNAPQTCWKLLNDHRAGLELLYRGLVSRPSPWVDAVESLLATMPPLAGEQEQAVHQLMIQGPPDEEVGLDAYSLDPRLNPHPDLDAEGVLS